MVFRRKYKKSKRTFKRKRYTTRPRRSIKIKTYPFTRMVALSTIVATSTNTQFGASVFSLSDVPGFGEFTTMFDFYKIKAIRLSFIPVSNVTLETGNAATIVPNTIYNQRIFTVIDYNDAGIPGTIDELRQYPNCKWSPGNKIHTRYFKPRVIIDANSVSSAVEYKAQPWINSSEDLDYYAIKWAIENSSAVGTQLYKLEAKYYMLFKNPR